MKSVISQVLQINPLVFNPQLVDCRTEIQSVFFILQSVCDENGVLVDHQHYTLLKLTQEELNCVLPIIPAIDAMLKFGQLVPQHMSSCMFGYGDEIVNYLKKNKF